VISDLENMHHCEVIRFSSASVIGRECWH